MSLLPSLGKSSLQIDQPYLNQKGWGNRGYLLQTIGETVFFLTLLVTPATAHKVQIAEDVGGTLHIEPNDNPKAGEPSLTWFALTRKGGQVIPLQQCNCQLTVYSEPRTQNASPILSPPLKAISAEGYQGIPGAEIVFPKPGTYQVQLSGTPASGANFQPFELKFPVTVAAGTAVPKASQSSQPSSQEPVPANRSASANSLAFPSAIALFVILGLGIAWLVWRRRK
ncbi:MULTISPECIES: hypothetical protein [unclassified Coleofasciculus]|uniref:hypothetical protein n=1 Tax=Cyanophyceae TaxID=3028117 RepID=UPI0018EF7195|nr:MULTISPECIES: hypothetical protein [unclassified Coleofasciculus]